MIACLLSAAQKLVVALALIALLTATGCKTSPKVDWNSRVGNYTFDQAIAEMGPPDKSSQLSDGSLVAEWIISRPSGGLSIGFGTGYSSGNAAVGVGQTVYSGGSQKFLRLTFGPDGRLTAHSTNRR